MSCNLSGGVALIVRFTTKGMCAKNKNIYAWREQAIIREIVTHDLSCCLLPRCEALCTCRSGFPIATHVMSLSGSCVKIFSVKALWKNLVVLVNDKKNSLKTATASRTQAWCLLSQSDILVFIFSGCRNGLADVVLFRDFTETLKLCVNSDIVGTFRFPEFWKIWHCSYACRGFCCLNDSSFAMKITKTLRPNRHHWIL